MITCFSDEMLRRQMVLLSVSIGELADVRREAVWEANESRLAAEDMVQVIDSLPADVCASEVLAWLERKTAFEHEWDAAEDALLRIDSEAAAVDAAFDLVSRMRERCTDRF